MHSIAQMVLGSVLLLSCTQGNAQVSVKKAPEPAIPRKAAPPPGDQYLVWVVKDACATKKQTMATYLLRQTGAGVDILLSREGIYTVDAHQLVKVQRGFKNMKATDWEGVSREHEVVVPEVTSLATGKTKAITSITTRFPGPLMEYKNSLCITGSLGASFILTNREAWTEGQGYDADRNFQRKDLTGRVILVLSVAKQQALEIQFLDALEAAGAQAEKLARTKYEATEKLEDGKTAKTVFKAAKLVDARLAFTGKHNRTQLVLTYGVTVTEYISQTSEPGSPMEEITPLERTERTVKVYLDSLPAIGLKSQVPPSFLKSLAPRLPKGYAVGGWIKLPGPGKERDSLRKAFEKRAAFVPERSR